MGPVSINVRYRPLRIGWCVEAESLDDFGTAVTLSHVFWGGRFNPIIPCAIRTTAKVLISAFNVDALYNISGTPAVDSFIQEFPHLRWPEFRPELFVGSSSGKRPTLLDVTHPARHLFDAHVDGRETPSISAVLYEWSAEDPLRYALLASCGAYPRADETGRDYSEVFQRALAASPDTIAVGEALPNDLHRHLTPNVLTGMELHSDSAISHWEQAGFYVGHGLDFMDLVNFWNLRACDIDLFFYDFNVAQRLEPFTRAYSEFLRSRPKRDDWISGINVWRKDRNMAIETTPFGSGVSICTVDDGLFNGLNLNPPVMGFKSRSVLGTAEENELGVSVTFQLPEKPFYSDIPFYRQMVVASLSAGNVGKTILTPPYIPQLNEYYGRSIYFLHNRARAERGSLGVIQDVTAEHLTIRALPFTDLVSKIFDAFGIKAHPSDKGLISSRLIDQMGGLQGCRVFKIAGVRALIAKYGPTASFERTEALQMIGNNDPSTHLPRFDAYARLFIEQRDKIELRPEDAFLYLLKKGVFRAGLNLFCPICRLTFWIVLDDLKTVSKCTYCGRDFNVLPQLRDRNWAYRRSGLFGRDDHQGGGIPVALTLQQLETALPWGILSYSTEMKLEPDSASIEECETDFVLLASDSLRGEKPVELVIGECKDRGGEISEEDVRKLTKVAQTFEGTPCRVFILFSKCGEFTAEEIARCKGARRKLFEDAGRTHYDNNVIMLSQRELEPYFIYEQTEKEFEIDRSAISLEDLAVNTNHVFFNPRRKPAPQT